MTGPRIPETDGVSGTWPALDRHPAPVDLTDTAARAQRDQLADRVDVLDRVGVLRALPDDFNSTTAMVAEFYQVEDTTIRQVVNRNREELDSDGYAVLTRGEVSDKLSLTSDELGMPRTAGSLALFPRRAVLRIGMLLRDSAVARQIRDYLLSAESRERQLDPYNLSRMQILEMAIDSERRALVAEARIEAERPMVERAKAHAAGTGTKTRQQFFRELKQWARDAHGIVVKQADVMAFLSTRKLGLFVGGNRTDTGQATAWAIARGYARNPEGTADNGHNFIRPVLTPTGQAYAWERCVRYIDENGTLELRLPIGAAR